MSNGQNVPEHDHPRIWEALEARDERARRLGEEVSRMAGAQEVLNESKTPQREACSRCKQCSKKSHEDEDEITEEDEQFDVTVDALREIIKQELAGK